MEIPWSIDFAPDGRIFVTERPGRIRVVENGKLIPEIGQNSKWLSEWRRLDGISRFAQF
ncbi:MAG: PQQ-dependent sugar dehydrogenase [Blastocatellia bacterium]|nr:PQQ-dependent sugar dehydrogenase [Blastocatellia bacterium]